MKSLLALFTIIPAICLTPRTAVALEPIGQITCRDAPVRIEIVDTVPTTIEWNRRYRVTHYLRNISDHYIILYSLERTAEFKYDSETISTGRKLTDSETLWPQCSFVSSLEDAYGNVNSQGKIEKDAVFKIAFQAAETKRIPVSMSLRFVYRFKTEIDGPYHEIATGWKKLRIRRS